MGLKITYDGPARSPAQTLKARKMIEELLVEGASLGHSASGWTAAIAIELCEERGLEYTVHCMPKSQGGGCMVEVRK